MSKVLVTGGAGFIGSHVVDAYISQGHQVAVLDNLSTGKKEFVNQKAEFFEADITDNKRVSEIISNFKPEIINHHAAHIQVGNSVTNPQFDAMNNVIGLLNIMQAAKKHGLRKFIMASTGGAMYGNQSTPFNEEMPASPLSPYGVSKRAGELYLNYYYEEFKIDYIVLRYANVYGPRQNPHGESGVVAIFSEMLADGRQPVINGDGNNTRDYVYVTDVVAANVAAINSNYVGVLNIGTTAEISTNEVFHKVVSEFGLNFPENHGPERPGEQKVSSLSFSKAQEILNWEPEIDFDKGVKLVADWYRQKPIQ